MKSQYSKARRRFIQSIRYCINALFVKNRRKLFFESFPDYSDNSRAFSDFLFTHGYTAKYRIYWAVDSLPDITDERIHFVLKKDRLRYIYHTITSFYLFSTHGAFSWCNPHLQKYVCFWHGTMLKRICQMRNPDDTDYLRQAWKFVAPSNYYVKYFSLSFGRNEDEILPLGYPRCDLLFQSNDSLLHLGIDVQGKTKIVVYMPTFRQPVGGGYTDSTKNVFEEDFIKFSDSTSIEKWNTFFKKRNIILIVKPHPSDKNAVRCDEKYKNIRIITSDKLQQNNVQLYSLLANADALVTDFSSVYCDFLLLDRPIGFVVTDIEEYGHGRGFVFDNPLDYMPGSIISTENEFVDFFDKLNIGQDLTKEKRDKLRLVFNQYQGGNNCKRIAEAIGLCK